MCLRRRQDPIRPSPSPADGNLETSSVNDVSSPASLLDDPTKSFLILLTGCTGSGKHSFVTSLSKLADAPQVVESGNGVFTATVPLSVLDALFAHRPGNLVLLCVPSFDGTLNKNMAILEITAKLLIEWHSRGAKVAAVVQLHDITQRRLSHATRSNLLLLQSMIGPAFFPRLLLGTTYWEEDITVHGEAREKELIAGVWKTLVDGGAHVARINFSVAKTPASDTLLAEREFGKGVRDTVADLVSTLAPNPPPDDPLMIQEIIGGNLALSDTTAARTLAQISRETEVAFEAIGDFDRQEGRGDACSCWRACLSRLNITGHCC